MHSLLTMVAGLGLFLFAMQQIEQAVQALFGEKAAGWLRAGTSTTLRGVVVGALITAVMQSSSLVGLLVLAFVSAGILPLRQAIAVMLGANLGTTITGWLVALLGFKLSLSGISLPLAGAGGLAWVLLPKGFWRAAGLFLFAFGLLIFGLDTMKQAVEGVGQRFDLAWLQGYPLILYLFAGAVLTAIIQSSSAAMLITLSALHGGLVGLPEALALVIGADLGTTSTLLLGALKGSLSKKQVAAFHVLYNVATALVAFVLVMPLWPWLMTKLGIHDPLYSLVAFHSGFNLLGIVIFMPFLGWFEKAIRRFIGKRDGGGVFTDIAPNSGEPALLVLDQHADNLVETIRQLCQRPLSSGTLEAFYHRYEAITDQELVMADYANRVAQEALSASQSERLGLLRSRVREAVYALKSVKDVVDDMAAMARSNDPGLRALDGHIRRYLETLYGEATVNVQNHACAMERLLVEAYGLVRPAREQGISVLNLAREIDESGRHWLRSRAADRGAGSGDIVPMV